MTLELHSGTVGTVTTRTVPGRNSTIVTIFSIERMNVQYYGDGSFINEGKDIIAAGKMLRNGVFRAYSIHTYFDNTTYTENRIYGLLVPIFIAFIDYEILKNPSSDLKMKIFSIAFFLISTGLSLAFALDAVNPLRSKYLIIRKLR